MITERERREALFAAVPKADTRPKLSGQWNQGQPALSQGPWSAARRAHFAATPGRHWLTRAQLVTACAATIPPRTTARVAATLGRTIWMLRYELHRQGWTMKSL